MIYFMQATGGGPVKIGYAKDIEVRRKFLESHYRKSLAVLATLPGGRAEEKAIHDRFRDLRIGQTEQFRPAKGLMDFIDRPLLVDQNPDVVEAMQGGWIFQMRGTVTWREWLSRFANKRRVTPSALIDQALSEAAERDGFELPPKRF